MEGLALQHTLQLGRVRADGERRRAASDSRETVWTVVGYYSDSKGTVPTTPTPVDARATVDPSTGPSSSSLYRPTLHQSNLFLLTAATNPASAKATTLGPDPLTSFPSLTVTTNPSKGEDLALTSTCECSDPQT